MKGLAGGADKRARAQTATLLAGWGEEEQQLDPEAEEMFMKYDKDSSNTMSAQEMREMLDAEGVLSGPSPRPPHTSAAVLAILFLCHKT